MDESTILKELIKIEKEEGYLPEKRLLLLAEEKKIPIAKIYQTATFYSFLTLKKRGKYKIRICNSPSCFLNGSDKIISYFEKILKIKVGQTTKDGKFTLETTSCIGCCNKPPAVLIQDKLYTDLTEEKIKEIIETCK